MTKKMTKAEAGRLGGLAVVEKYGRKHMAQIGALGYQATVNKHFDGDANAANTWLSKKGRYVADKDATYGPVFEDPGPHPAHKEDTLPF